MQTKCIKGVRLWSSYKAYSFMVVLCSWVKKNLNEKDMRKGTSFAKKRAILFHRVEALRTQIWHTGVRSTWHSLKEPTTLNSGVLFKENKHKQQKKKKRQSEKDKVMLEMAHVSKKDQNFWAKMTQLGLRLQVQLGSIFTYWRTGTQTLN